MKILRICVTILFIAMLTAFILFFYREKFTFDNTFPVITVENGMIDVSLSADDEELLQGVSAYDGKDGDLTDQIVVESISKFSEPGVCTVTYAVSDSNNNVASMKRQIRYIDYTPPVFKLTKPLIYKLTETVNVLDAIRAYDVIDGNISNNIMITATDYTTNTTGVFSILAQVSNSKGDVIYLDLPVYVEDISAAAPDIELSDYIIYLKTGDEFNPADYIVSALDISGIDITGRIIFNTDYSKSKAGTYFAHYYATDDAGRKSHSILVIIAED